MANIKVKRSSVAGRVPLVTDLALGELAVNTYDGLAFIKKSADGVESIVQLGGGGSGAGDLQKRYSYTATAGQTTFLAEYSAPYVDVYLNGVRLSTTDFTATNNSSVILGTPAVAGDLVQVIGHKVFGIAEALPLTGGTMTGAIAFAAGQTWPTFNQNTTGTAANVTGTVAIANGGTGETTRQAAMDALAGAVTAGQYLRGNGTDVVMSAIQAADVPTLNQNTTGSAATLATGRTIALTGDVTYTSGSFNGSANVTGTATLANSGATAGTYGNATNIPQIAVDAKGRITSVSNVAVSIPSGSITITGDVTGTGSTGASTALTLASVGTAGTYTKVTTDAKGRVTSGTTLAAADIPPLDASKITSGVIDAARLPSYVDDVVEAANLAAFPATGETGKIYVALDTNKAYRWSGSAYIYITSGAVDSVAGRTGVVTLTKTDVGLANVDNTTDAAKPVSSAQQTALNLKANLASPTFTGTVSGITASMVGLGNVENKSSATIRGEITSANVTTALGFTPYNSTNPSGYITSSALSSYLPLSGGSLTGALTSAGTYTSTNNANVDGSNYIVNTINKSVSLYAYEVQRSGSTVGGILIGGAGAFATGTTVAGNIVLHAGNYTSYSPTLTGGSASGTWGISVTGNAATATTATNLSGGTINGLTLNQFNANNPRLYSATTGATGLLGVDSAGTFRYQVYGDGTNQGFLNAAWGGWDVRKVAGSHLYLNTQTTFYYGDTETYMNRVYGVTDIRAPIFYDNQNTGFYVDPNDNSILSNLAVNGNAIRQGNNLSRPLSQWASTGSTGMVFFELPGTTSNYGMVHMVFDIYEYNGNAVSTVIVGGHNWNGAWYNVSANVIGQTDKAVRLAVRGGKYVVCFGNSGSYWSYGTVMLRKIHNGAYYDNIISMGAQFVANITTTESLSWDSGDLRALRTPSSFTAGTTINAGGTITASGTISSSADVRAPMFYDSNDTFYYDNPAGTSSFNVIRSYALAYQGSVSSDNTWGIYFDSGLSSSYGVYRGSGAWNHPYPDLRIAFHTGIQLGANPGYGGTRFYNETDMATEIFSVGNTDNNVRVGYTLFSPNLYDSNNTAFYVDPASTTNLNVLFVGGQQVTGGASGMSSAKGYFFSGF